MRDGYYLSAYLTPAGPHRLVHVCLRHDNNVALWEKRGDRVRLVRHWELERISGQKMHRTPFLDQADVVAFVDRLLAPLGLSLADMVEVWGTPGLDTVDDYHWVREYPDLAFHSLCHLYSAVLLDSDVFFTGTVVGLAVDRGPDRVLDGAFKEYWFAGCVVRQGTMRVFPVESPGSLYTAARDRFGLREGTLMALATASKAVGECDREAVLDAYRFDRLDVIEQSDAAFERIHREVAGTLTPDPAFTDEENLASAVVKEVQAISVRVMERNVDGLLARSGVDPTEAWLALAGGYALNCPTNSHLIARYGFRGLLAPPSVGDDGQAVGIGLAAFHKKLGRRFSFTYPGAYLGREESDVDAALAGFAPYVAEVTPYRPEVAVDDLLAGPVAWFDGPSEVGPRALGNRSLLGDPTTTATKDELNRVKGREWWRPVAPVVLAERVAEWFVDGRPSPYMLETFPVRPERREQVPAIAHLDFSARVQTVDASANPVLHELLRAFERRTGVPMLCNTSLNDKGEPIVDLVAEALNFCLRKRVAVVYVNRRRVVLRDFDGYPVSGPLPRSQGWFTDPPADRASAVLARANPHGLPDLYLHLYLRDLALAERYDLRSAKDVAAVRAELDRRLAVPGARAAAEQVMRRNASHIATFGGAATGGAPG